MTQPALKRLSPLEAQVAAWWQAVFLLHATPCTPPPGRWLWDSNYLFRPLRDQTKGQSYW